MTPPIDDLLELVGRGLQPPSLDTGDAEPQHEGEDQGRHDIHERRHGDREVGRELHPALGEGGRSALEQHGEERSPREVAPESGKERESVGQGGGQRQKPSGTASQIGDAGRHESQNQQRDDKGQELPEQGIERQRDPHRPVGQEQTAENARGNGRNHPRQQTCFSLHRRTIFVKV